MKSKVVFLMKINIRALGKHFLVKTDLKQKKPLQFYLILHLSSRNALHLYISIKFVAGLAITANLDKTLRCIVSYFCSALFLG